MIDLRASVIPTANKGKTATEKRISVAENGQLRFNSLASEFIAKSVKNPDEVVIFLLLDDDRSLLIDTKPFTKKEFPELKENYTIEDGKKLSFNKDLAVKEGQHLYYTSIAGWLTACGYDFRGSGAQNFNLVTSDKNKETRLVWRNMPTGSLTRRQFTPRKRKDKAASIEAAKEPELVEA